MWIFTIDEARELAQQHSEKGMRQLYWRKDRVDATPSRFEADMDDYHLEHRAGRLFPSGPANGLDARG